MKKIFAAILCISILASLSLPFSAVSAEPIQKTKAEIVEEFKSTYQIGTWIPYALDDEGVRNMKENGLDYIYLFWYENKDVALPLCEKYDIKCILDLSIGPDTTEEVIRETMKNKYLDSPAVIGIHLADEPSAEKFDGLSRALKICKQLRPELLYSINLYPQYAQPAQLGTTSYQEYIDLFVEKVGLDFISTDIYPYTTGTEKTYFENLDIISDSCIKNNLDFWLHIQSMSFGMNRSPTLADLTAQAYIGMSFGAKKLMHFCYAKPHPGLYEENAFGNGSVTYTGVKTPIWDYTKAINDEIKLIFPILEKYKNLGAYTVDPGRRPTYVDNFKNQYTDFGIFKELNGTRATLIGCFEEKTNNLKKAFTLVNAEEILSKRVNTVTFSFNSPKIVTAYPDGVKTPMTPDVNGIYTITFQTGDGAFFEVEDLPLDYKFNISDAMSAFREIAGKTHLDYVSKFKYDRNGDGLIKIEDAMIVFKVVAGKITLD